MTTKQITYFDRKFWPKNSWSQFVTDVVTEFWIFWPKIIFSDSQKNLTGNYIFLTDYRSKKFLTEYFDRLSVKKVFLTQIVTDRSQSVEGKNDFIFFYRFCDWFVDQNKFSPKFSDLGLTNFEPKGGSFKKFWISSGRNGHEILIVKVEKWKL